MFEFFANSHQTFCPHQARSPCIKTIYRALHARGDCWWRKRRWLTLLPRPPRTRI